MKRRSFIGLSLGLFCGLPFSHRQSEMPTKVIDCMFPAPIDIHPGDVVAMNWTADIKVEDISGHSCAYVELGNNP